MALVHGLVPTAQTLFLCMALDRTRTPHGERERRRSSKRPMMKNMSAGSATSFQKISLQQSVKIFVSSLTTTTHSGREMLFRHDFRISGAVFWTVYVRRFAKQKRSSIAALIQANSDEQCTDIIGHTKAVPFLGTPHRGSSFTRWGTLFAKALQPIESNPSILAELVYDSVSLFDLHREFVKVTGDGLRVVNFVKERKTSVLKLWFIQWEAFCVPEQSATYEGSYIQNTGLPVHHYGLNKFGSRNANYQTILSGLLQTITPFMSQMRDPLYSVPIESVQSYVERHGLSPAIKEKLRAFHENGSVPHALAIYGLGSTGETQLALKYIENHKNDYNPILWIDAKDGETVRSSFERSAGELQLSVDRAST
ncbi:MAG: hypothetical protein M1816_004798 [Peltula sp. TS41687]|nr:MAG: hypothetical protein M1816_004798 [Peltula sp. TS41687]